MKKESLIAIILGIILGVATAFLAVKTLKTSPSSSSKIIKISPSPTIKITPQKIQPLTITSPSQNFLTNQKSIKIQGKGEKNSLLIIFSPTAEKILKLQQESFSVDFPLSLGENLIKIVAYQKQKIEEKTLKVFYLEE